LYWFFFTNVRITLLAMLYKTKIKIRKKQLEIDLKKININWQGGLLIWETMNIYLLLNHHFHCCSTFLLWHNEKLFLDMLSKNNFELWRKQWQINLTNSRVIRIDVFCFKIQRLPLFQKNILYIKSSANNLFTKAFHCI
jgi:hypothetical protein